MGFFDRSKKVKREIPGGTSQDQRQPHPPPPFPSPSLPPSPATGRRYADGAYPPPPASQPAGLLPPPSGWNGPASHPTSHYQQSRPYAPVVVNQHYYFSPPAPFQQPPPPFQQPQMPYTGGSSLSKLNLGSVVDLAEDLCPRTGLPQLFDDGLPSWHHYRTQLLNQSAALYDQISTRFDDVVTRIDMDRYVGSEKNTFLALPVLAPPPSAGSAPDLRPAKGAKKGYLRNQFKGQTTAVATSVVSDSYFAKVDLYANSRLPMQLPPFKLYIPTYPILCLAAQYSERVYEKPRGAERDAYVDSDYRTGTKAMVIKSVPMDHMNTIVFAIRGTATFMDWAVNLNMAPASPAGFLDDAGNFCHAGFLSVARRMVGPVARRLRQLLEEDPGRSSHSLLITGHSAGGAVASLLYSHMLATSTAAESELNILAGCFRRIHCVTFGAPPVSLLPLVGSGGGGDPRRGPRSGKSLFLSFVNEGDPVVRADKAYVRSLFELFAAPVAGVDEEGRKPERAAGGGRSSDKRSKISLTRSKEDKPERWPKSSRSGAAGSSSSSSNNGSSRSRKSGPVWQVPPGILSNAGRIVVLRSGDPKARLDGKKTVEERLNEGVVAQVTTDEQLRSVIWGDPVCHVMRLYSGRIETLAVGAITAQGY